MNRVLQAVRALAALSVWLWVGCAAPADDGGRWAPEERDASEVQPVMSAAVASELAEGADAELRVLVRYRQSAPLGPQARPDVHVGGPFAGRGAELARQWRAAGLRVRRSFGLSPWVAMTVTATELERLLSDSRVARVELDPAGTGQLLQAGPLVGLAAVQGAGHTGDGVKVAVLDTGLESTHQDLTGALAAEACFCGNDCCPGGGSTESGAGSAADGHGHGTHVSGTIAGRGNVGPTGMAPAAQVVAVKVLDDGNVLWGLSDVVAGLEWVLAQHPDTDVVNLSLGTLGAHAGNCDAAEGIAPLAAAADASSAAGIALVAASGNGGASDGMSAPACIASVIGVGATWDADVGPEAIFCQEPATFPDLIACFSNASATTDLVAPGARITASWLLDSARARVGTSHAAPLVSGCLAALIDAYPAASVGELRAALAASPVRLTDAKNDRVYPRLDCADALARLAPPPPPPEDDAGMDEDAGMELDAGSSSDAGMDAGSAGDAGATDAGGAMDGSTDAAMPAPDAAPDGSAPGDGSDDDAGAAADADAGTEGDGSGPAPDAGGARPRAPSTPEPAPEPDREPDDAGPPATPTDGSAALPDAPGDAGARTGTDAGCACSLARPQRPSAATALPWLLAAALWLRRRRRHLAGDSDDTSSACSASSASSAPRAPRTSASSR